VATGAVGAWARQVVTSARGGRGNHGAMLENWSRLRTSPAYFGSRMGAVLILIISSSSLNDRRRSRGRLRGRDEVLFCPWVEPEVDGLQPLLIDVGVNLGRSRCRRGRAFLDDAEVGAVAEQVRGEAVPQKVRIDVEVEAGVLRGSASTIWPDADGAEPCAPRGEEDLVAVSFSQGRGVRDRGRF